MAHTPGPWEVRGEFIGPRLRADSGIQIKIARVSGPLDDAETIANAKLIAAAPDLLFALKYVWDTYGLDPSIDSAIWQTVLAAVAKAEA